METAFWIYMIKKRVLFKVVLLQVLQLCQAGGINNLYVFAQWTLAAVESDKYLLTLSLGCCSESKSRIYYTQCPIPNGNCYSKKKRPPTNTRWYNTHCRMFHAKACWKLNLIMRLSLPLKQSQARQHYCTVCELGLHSIKYRIVLIEY